MFRSDAPGCGVAHKGHQSKGIANNRTLDPVLVVLHQKSSKTGAVGNWLKHQGFRLDIRRPVIGDTLPEQLDKHAGIIVFGGPMSANDPCPQIRKEIDWLSLVLEHKIPFFGICLGAQMMARQLGAKVLQHKKGFVEIGYHQVEVTREGEKLIENWPGRFFQWHNEGFQLPEGATALANGIRFENQAYSYGGHVIGVQFHPETTQDIIKQWAQNSAPMLTKKGAHITERLLADHQKFGEAQLDWLHRCLTCWTSIFKHPQI